MKIPEDKQEVSFHSVYFFEQFKGVTDFRRKRGVIGQLLEKTRMIPDQPFPVALSTEIPDIINNSFLLIGPYAYEGKTGSYHKIKLFFETHGSLPSCFNIQGFR